MPRTRNSATGLLSGIRPRNASNIGRKIPFMTEFLPQRGLKRALPRTARYFQVEQTTKVGYELFGVAPSASLIFMKARQSLFRRTTNYNLSPTSLPCRSHNTNVENMIPSNLGSYDLIPRRSKLELAPGSEVLERRHHLIDATLP